MQPRHHMSPHARRCEDSLLATLRAVLGFGAVPKGGAQAELQIGVRRPTDGVPGLQVVISGPRSAGQVGILVRHRDGAVLDLMVFQAPPGFSICDGMPGRQGGEPRCLVRLVHSQSASGEEAVQAAISTGRLAAACFQESSLAPVPQAPVKAVSSPGRGLLRSLSSLFFVPDQPPPEAPAAEPPLRAVVHRLRSSRTQRLRDLGFALDACGGLPPETVKGIAIRVGDPLVRIMDGLDRGAALDARAQADLDRIQATLGEIVKAVRDNARNALTSDVGIIAHVSADRLEELLPGAAPEGRTSPF